MAVLKILSKVGAFGAPGKIELIWLVPEISLPGGVPLWFHGINPVVTFNPIPVRTACE